MDLSGVEGLSEEQTASILAAHNADVEGLKNQQAKLVDETKSAKQAASENANAVEEARKAAADTEARNLELQGKYDEAQKIREAEKAKLVAEAHAIADKYKNALEAKDMLEARSPILSKVLDQFKPAAEAILAKNIDIAYDDEGNAKTVFRHGEQEFSSASDFIDGVSGDAMWDGMLRGADSSGAGTKQSKESGASSTGNSASDNLQKRLKQKGMI